MEKIRIRDGINLDPALKKFRSGMEKSRIRDPRWKKFGSGMEKIWIRDPGWKKFGSGMEKSRIRDKHPGSAKLNCTGRYLCGRPPDRRGR
jgi:hypothetical protein